MDVIITNGGTGISLRDSAFEMVSEILAKKIDGFGELFRMVTKNLLPLLSAFDVTLNMLVMCVCSSHMKKLGLRRC